MGECKIQNAPKKGKKIRLRSFLHLKSVKDRQIPGVPGNHSVPAPMTLMWTQVMESRQVYRGRVIKFVLLFPAANYTLVGIGVPRLQEDSYFPAVQFPTG